MKKRKIVHIPLIVLASLLTLASNCKKDKKKDPVTIEYKLGDCKNYMYFKVGTYWVYQNDVTNEIDSQWVSFSTIDQSTQHGDEDYSKHITLIQETLWTFIASNFVDGWGRQNKFEIYTSGQNVNAYPYPTSAYQFEKSKKNSSSSHSNTVYYQPLNLCPKKNCFYYYDTTLTNYSLNGFTYDTVRVFRVNGDAVFQESNQLTIGGGKSDYYYAKNIGLIKVFHDSYHTDNKTPYKQSWNLIRKNIIQ